MSKSKQPPLIKYPITFFTPRSMDEVHQLLQHAPSHAETMLGERRVKIAPKRDPIGSQHPPIVYSVSLKYNTGDRMIILPAQIMLIAIKDNLTCIELSFLTGMISQMLIVIVIVPLLLCLPLMLLRGISCEAVFLLLWLVGVALYFNYHRQNLTVYRKEFRDFLRQYLGVAPHQEKYRYFEPEAFE